MQFYPWNVTRTGQYAQDCAAGRRYAEEYLRAGDEYHLSHIVREMVVRGPESFGGVEIGFLTAIAERAL